MINFVKAVVRYHTELSVVLQAQKPEASNFAYAEDFASYMPQVSLLKIRPAASTDTVSHTMQKRFQLHVDPLSIISG